MGKMVFSFMFAIGILVGAIVVGVLMIVFGQVLLAVREIAINTRKTDNPIEYKTLEFVATINYVIGWIVMIGGFILGVIYIILMSIR